MHFIFSGKEKLWDLIYTMAIDPLAKVHFNDNYMQAFKPGSKISRTALMRQVFIYLILLTHERLVWSFGYI